MDTEDLTPMVLVASEEDLTLTEEDMAVTYVLYQLTDSITQVITILQIT